MNVEGDGFRMEVMELARMLSFKDVCRIWKDTSEVQLPDDISPSKPIEIDVSNKDGTANESNNSQFTRLPRDLEISLFEENGSLLIQCLNKLRDYASEPEEFYSSLSKEQWLRTVVNSESKSALQLCSGDFSENDFRHFTIQCNVVPCEPYWEKLQSARSNNDNEAGAISKGVYFPSTENFQLTRDDQQEYNILRGWIERYDNEMIGQANMSPKRSLPEIKPSDGDLRLKALSSRAKDSGRFREEFWRGGLFGVKVFHEQNRNIFSKEVQVLEAIGTHPHIVYSFGVSTREGKDGCKYWMEKLDGDLDDLIIELSRSCEDLPFSVIDAMNILLQIAKAMTRLHKLNVIHGDLKAANILVSHYEVLGDVMLYVVKVADFDSAKIIQSDNQVFHITGTDEYIAPEVWERRGTSGTLSGPNAMKCDVYSFGIVAVEVLVGQISIGIQKDFGHDRRDDIMAPLEAIGIYHLYPDLIDLVDRCLNHVSSLRPPFEEVTRELNYIIDDVLN